MSLIKCSDVAFSYDGNVVLSGVNFSVDCGDYLCIVGENGSGKSTLLKGLLKLKTPSHGKIETGDGLISSEIGYMPQQTVVQKDFPASVREVVISGCLNSSKGRPFYSDASRKNAEEKIKILGIESIKNKCYRELSGGQQQRVLLARALCATKRLLLLDEPVGGLDPLATSELYRVIREINQDRGITVVMVSHDIHAAMHDATHILHLGNTQLFFGTKSDYLDCETGKLFLCAWGGHHDAIGTESTEELS